MDSVLHLHSGHDCLLISRVADGDFEANIVVYWYIHKFAKRKRSVLQGLDTLTVAKATPIGNYVSGPLKMSPTLLK